MPLAVSVTDLAKALLDERRRAGVAIYGHELSTHNGRSSLTDAIEEVADLLCYLVQLREELRDLAGGAP